MSSRELQLRIRELLEPTVARLGYELIAVEWVVARRGTLRLSIDKPGGVGAGDCAGVSRRVGPALDEADLIETAYDLEVSSPGIERPLQRLVDFRRFVGFRARLRAEEGLPRRRWTGTLRGVEGEDVCIEVDGQLHRVPHACIEAAHLLLDLETYQTLAAGLPPIAEGNEATINPQEEP